MNLREPPGATSRSSQLSGFHAEELQNTAPQPSTSTGPSNAMSPGGRAAHHRWGGVSVGSSQSCRTGWTSGPVDRSTETTPRTGKSGSPQSEEARMSIRVTYQFPARGSNKLASSLQVDTVRGLDASKLYRSGTAPSRPRRTALNLPPSRTCTAVDESRVDTRTAVLFLMTRSFECPTSITCARGWAMQSNAIL